MGFIKKAMKGVSAEDRKSAGGGGGFVGLDAGDYEARIIDVQLKKFSETSKNPGKPYLALELGIMRNWDGEEVNPEQKVRAMVGLISHWSSGSLNYTLFHFLKALKGGWDFDEDEPLLEIEDEQDAQDTLLGEELNVSIKYDVRKPSEQYPNPAVFLEVDRFLLQDADLGPNLRLGDYASFREKINAQYGDGATVAPARQAARNASGDTDVDFKL